MASQTTRATLHSARFVFFFVLHFMQIAMPFVAVVFSSSFILSTFTYIGLVCSVPDKNAKPNIDDYAIICLMAIFGVHTRCLCYLFIWQRFDFFFHKTNFCYRLKFLWANKCEIVKFAVHWLVWHISFCFLRFLDGFSPSHQIHNRKRNAPITL